MGLISLLGTLSAQNSTGLALSLDGDGDYVDFGNSTQANFDTSDFTIEYWIKKYTTRTEAVLAKRSICNQGSFWSMRAAEKINIEVDQNSSGTNYLILEGPTPIVDIQYHHVAVTRTEDSITIYIDGIYDTSGSSINTTNISNSASLLIGYGPCVNTFGTNYFTGFIDEVRIWNVARTNNQIQSKMFQTLGPEYYSTADSGLVAYYRFDQLENLGVGGDGLVDDIRDLTIYQNHGDLVGDATLDTSDVPLGVEDRNSTIPSKFQLSQNFPNPFNPTTTINFSIPEAYFVSLKVFNCLGQEIVTLVSKELNAGNYKYDWNATNLPSGIYFYRIQVGSINETKKMILLK